MLIKADPHVVLTDCCQQVTLYEDRMTYIESWSASEPLRLASGEVTRARLRTWDFLPYSFL